VRRPIRGHQPLGVAIPKGVVRPRSLEVCMLKKIVSGRPFGIAVDRVREVSATITGIRGA